jgi:hypothetical protein
MRERDDNREEGGKNRKQGGIENEKQGDFES